MNESFSQQHLASQLQDAGFSEKTARVYATLARFGNATPSVIAHASNINRSTAYKILTDLSIKGLISELQHGKKLVYQIESPKKLLQFTEQRAHQWKEYAKKTQLLLPELHALFSASPGKPQVRFYQGIEGIKDVYRDHLAQAESYEMVGMSNTAELRQIVPASFLKQYVKQKAQQKITSRGILPDTIKDLRYRDSVYAGIAQNYCPKFRYIPSTDFPFQGEITLYGTSSLSCINLTPHGCVGVIIEDEVIAKMFRLMFELAWKGAGSSVKGR